MQRAFQSSRKLMCRLKQDDGVGNIKTCRNRKEVRTGKTKISARCPNSFPDAEKRKPFENLEPKTRSALLCVQAAHDCGLLNATDNSVARIPNFVYP
jgi:hypothetical protein